MEKLEKVVPIRPYSPLPIKWKFDKMEICSDFCQEFLANHSREKGNFVLNETIFNICCY